jgi:hypothetical protein
MVCLFLTGVNEMEQQCSLEKPKLPGRVLTASNLRRLMDVLGVGMLFAALVGMPYDQLFGLSRPISVAMQSLISAVAFSSLLSNWPSEVKVEKICFL